MSEPPSCLCGPAVACPLLFPLLVCPTPCRPQEPRLYMLPGPALQTASFEPPLGTRVANSGELAWEDNGNRLPSAWCLVWKVGDMGSWGAQQFSPVDFSPHRTRFGQNGAARKWRIGILWSRLSPFSKSGKLKSDALGKAPRASAMLKVSQLILICMQG